MNSRRCPAFNSGTWAVLVLTTMFGFPLICRYCVCTTCFGTHKILKPFKSHLHDKHSQPCLCHCSTCVFGECTPLVVDLNWVQSHFLCPKAQLLQGSDFNDYPWLCLKLQCEKCFLNKASVLMCPATGMLDPDNVMKWEKWGSMGYTAQHDGSSCSTNK